MRIIAIPTEIADTVRSTGKAPVYGHPSYTDVAKGYGPCRHCLRAFRAGEESRTLFTYSPFLSASEVPLPGPIYIHAEACSRFDEAAGYPEDMRPHPVVLNVYGSGQQLLEQEHVDDGRAEIAMGRLFERVDAAYIHVRDKKAGCYDFRVER